MNKQETSALRHATEWLRYQNSPQAQTDALAERRARAKRDRAMGHVPQCSLTRCAGNCPKRTP